MRRSAAAVLLAVGALLLTPGAAGEPNVPGDPTPPVVVPQIAATLGTNGWYVTNVTVNWSVTDPESIILSTSGCDTRTLTADTTGITLTCTATSDGGTTTVSKTFKIDKTAPSVTSSPARPPDANGWYNHALSVSFAGTDTTSGIASCVAPRTYSGPDSGSAAVSGSCTDNAGNVGSTSLSLSYDASAPTVTPTPGRSPDSNGWYNHALAVSFVGSDPTSGIDTCTQVTYAGPDSGNASVSGFCRDRAGNQSATSTFPFSYDATAPQVTGSSGGRVPDANGWYNHSVSIGFSGSDAASGIASCTQLTYSGPDSGNASVSGSCRDRAGNQSGSSSFGFRYDATNPSVTATASRSADSNGWYNHELTVSFPGADATSGIASCTAPRNYSGPDSGSITVSGACTDNAGNIGSSALSFGYDASGPAVTAMPRRNPDANGWYNHSLTVDFVGSDPTSGIASCTSPQTYSGPDNSAASVSGSCRDNAGNVDPGSVAVRYDATAPSVTGSAARSPDAHGWYNHPVSITFSGSDATSGIGTCTEATYSGPDSNSAAVGGTCVDRAGNQSASSSFGLRYDATAPQVGSAVAVRPPDQGGWYNHAITFSFQGQDAMSGMDSCPPTTYAGPDAGDASVTGTCVDQAGNSGSAMFPLRYDGTGPSVTASASRGPDADGWYNHPLTVSFAGSDGASGVDSCAAPKSYDGPDGAGAAVTASCVDKAGNVAFGSLGLKYDATAPRMLGADANRAPDSNGWFNHALTVAFRGSDATSQIAGCTQASYAGPDNGSARVSGSCRDHAGNVSGSIDYGLKYDATAPKPANVTAAAGDRVVTLRWQPSEDTTRVSVVRFAGTQTRGIEVYGGSADSFTDRGLTNGIRYRYEMTAFDDAGNAATSSASASPRAPLYLPAAGARVTAPPLLAWAPASRARYYNVQVWRRGRKIFSAWPSGTRIHLKRSWTYRGRQYHLTPGRYRWYVWPGYGPRSAKRYGRLLGSSSFVVVAR